MRISEFEWDEGNALHLQLNHGIEPNEAEEVFAVAPLIRRLIGLNAVSKAAPLVRTTRYSRRIWVVMQSVLPLSCKSESHLRD
jgi:hypothetical protein